jgi:TonB family protein
MRPLICRTAIVLAACYYNPSNDLTAASRRSERNSSIVEAVRACILLLAASTAAAQNPAAVPCKKPSSSHKTEFPLAFRYRSSAPLDPTWARSVFDSIAGQWSHPPFKHQRTDLTFTLRRDSALKTYHVLHASGDKDFDLLAARALALAAVGHKLPPLPASYAGDSVEFIIMFGDLASYIDSASAGSDRHPPEPWDSNEKPKWPSGYRVIGGSVPVIAQFEIDTMGRVDTATIRITSAPNDDFAAAVRSVIPNWRFSPAVEQCRPVRSSYEYTQKFGTGP